MTVRLKVTASRALFQIERFRFLFSQSTDRQFILIGEKEGWQARDNAYHLFRYLHDSGRRDVFFVTRKGNEDFGSLVRFGNSLVTYNSRRHYYMLFRSKLLILNDGYSDPSAPASRDPEHNSRAVLLPPPWHPAIQEDLLQLGPLQRTHSPVRVVHADRGGDRAQPDDAEIRRAES